MAQTQDFDEGTIAADRGRTPEKAGSISIPLSSGTRWQIGAAAVSLLLFYFIGLDQGATSVFGNDMHIHELMHDARHLLGFPCH